MSDRRRPGYRDVQGVKDLVTDDQVGDALRYRAEIAHIRSLTYAEVDFCTYVLRNVEARLALEATGSVQIRLWTARAHPDYIEAIHRLKIAQAEHKEVETKYEAAETMIRVWQTIHADKRPEMSGGRNY